MRIARMPEALALPAPLQANRSIARADQEGLGKTHAAPLFSRPNARGVMRLQHKSSLLRFIMAFREMSHQRIGQKQPGCNSTRFYSQQALSLTTLTAWHSSLDDCANHLPRVFDRTDRFTPLPGRRSFRLSRRVFSKCNKTTTRWTNSTRSSASISR